MENIVKNIKDKSEIDYTVNSSMTFFVEDNCRYCVSIVKNYFADIDGIEPNQEYTVTVLGPRGTFSSIISREEVGVELEADVKGYFELIGQKAFSIIEEKLKGK